MTKQIINNQNKNAEIKTKSKLYFSMPSSEEMHHLIEFCKVMASAPFYQKLGPGGVMAIYLTAKEYDLPFMACLNGGLHTFDGKVTFSAIMINSLILKAGHKADVLELDETKCVIRFTRGDRANDPTYEPLIYQYTIQQAQKAGYLSKNNWKSSPKDMLYSRCLTGGGRKHTPEVFVGVLVAGELVGDDSDSNVEPLLPDNVNTPVKLENTSVEEQKAPVEPKQVEFVKAEGFDEFCVKHGLQGKTKKAEYVTLLAKTTKRTRDALINQAVANPEGFLEAFEEWEKDEKEKAIEQKKTEKSSKSPNDEKEKKEES
jgi:hypothetical protein